MQREAKKKAGLEPEKWKKHTPELRDLGQEKLQKELTKEKGKIGMASSILVGKHFEPLDLLLQASEARLKPLETL